MLEKALKLKNWSIAHRRYLHQYPELSLEEKNTSQYCQKILKELGYRISQCWGYGFIADFNVDNAFNRIAWRTDMDALPIIERSNKEYVSRNNGIAHMCGHDAHMAIALTAARIIAENKSNIKNNVRFIFQPAEEGPGGAINMIEHGAIDNVDEIYGLHVSIFQKVGKIMSMPGVITANADVFNIKIIGKSCHAAYPEDGLNPLDIASELILKWKNLFDKIITTNPKGVLTTTMINCGVKENIVPNEVSLTGVVRTFGEDARAAVKLALMQDLNEIKKNGYQYEYEFVNGYDSVVNDARCVEKINQAVLSVGDLSFELGAQPLKWAEDFGYFTQKIPGAVFMLAAGNLEKGISNPLHADNFDIDEDAIPVGAAVAVELLRK